MPSADDMQVIFDIEADTDVIQRGEQTFHNTLHIIQTSVDPAYSFILHRFNRVAISQDRLDTIIYMDEDMQPTIGINFKRFSELEVLARVSCIEHNVGHLMSGHLGDQLGFQLQEYCQLKYGDMVGRMIYYLTIETVADCFVSYPGSVRSAGRVFYDIGKLGLDRWAPTINVLREIEKNVPVMSDEARMRQNVLKVAKELMQPPTTDMPDVDVDKDGKSLLFDYEDLFRDVDERTSKLTGGLPVNDLLVSGDKAEAMVANDQMQRMVKAAIDRTSTQKSRGYLSGDSKQFIEALDTSPKISLHQQISRACSSALSEERRTSRTRINRRVDYYMGRTSRNATTAVFIADTSISMTDEDLAHVDAEVKYLAAVTEGNLHLVFCDAGVAKCIEYRRGMCINEFFGRGGTAFSPALTFIKSKFNRDMPDLVIYFTDGYGECLDNKPPIINDCESSVIWVLTPGGRSEEQFKEKITKQGTVIKIEQWT